MSSQQTDENRIIGRRIQVKRRPRRREVFEDTTLTDSWPPRLNTNL
ncbi:MAG TPA: hypothetical protein VKV34_11660 [Thermoleophilia bacterium]|jgi:hypothetical protein|nr:hypothetical protein [Thermoleophilia bacterium]